MMPATPLTIHRYWTGSPPPADSRWTANALVGLNPGYTLIDWDDESLPPEALAWMEAQPGVRAEDAERHRGNLARLWLLNHYGGWWVDYDVIMLRPFATLPAPAMAAHRAGSACSCVMGFPARHPMIATAMANIGVGGDWRRRSPDTSGEALLRRHLTPDVELLPLPFSPSGRPVPGSEPWAVHLYGTSAKRIGVVG